MAKHWTPQDDEFLLRYHNLGANFIASHDLGRPDGAGKRRMDHLTRSGARLAHARAQLFMMEYLLLSGISRASFDVDVTRDERDYWASEIAELVE